jgi:septal ring factor EnvC (AmiA/AmiB activator)
LKSLSSIDEQLIELAKNLKEIEVEIKASSDPEERQQLRNKGEQLRTKKKQLRNEKWQLRKRRPILLRRHRQDGSNKLFRLYVRSVVRSGFRGTNNRFYAAFLIVYL